MPPWTPIDLDAFIRDHRAALVEHFAVDCGQGPDGAERLVCEVLLRAQVNYDYFESEGRAFDWCRLSGANLIRDGLHSMSHLLSQIDPRYGDALRQRAAGQDDETIARRMGMGAERVPALMRRAREAAAILREQW